MQATRRSSCLIVLTLFAIACGQGDAPLGAASSATVRGIAQAATAPPDFVDELVVTGFDSPTAFAFAPGGDIYVAEQDGRVRIVRDGALLPRPFVTLAASSESERGLLGIALHPNFASNRQLYVYYTASSPTVHNRISRLTAAGDVAAPGSETILFELEDLRSCLIHNGGALHFAPDGMLYAAIGDMCEPTLVQRMDRFAGKMLRLRPDGSIPDDNPFFASTTGAYRAIWALGLRNPYTFAVSRSGRVFINDVGLESWEEINEGAPGANFGWPLSEGPTSTPGQTGPLFSYPHSGSGLQGCAVTGGTFYEPSVANFPSSYEGKYLFADYCRNFVRTLDPSTRSSQPFLEEVRSVVDLRVGPDGALYRLERKPGGISRVRHVAAGQAPVIAFGPEDRSAAIGQQVTFSVRASGTEPLQYQWHRDGAAIAGATGPTHTFTASAADDGAAFHVIVRNAFGVTTSRDATLAVSSNAAPVVAILTPSSGARYSGGESISFRGNASDPEDGALPASAFTWEVVFHHDAHTHPFLAPFSGQTAGTFTVPRIGHTETNVFFRIHLRARDSAGRESAAHVDVSPRLANLLLRTEPPGLTVTLDGSPRLTPASVPSVVGVTRTLGAASPQTLSGTTYLFSSWSDGGATQHVIDTPATDTTYTARFAADGCPLQELRPSLVRASSAESPALGPMNAADGDLATRWSSLFSDPQWITFDLGAPRTIERVVLHWETAYASDYQLQVSDGADGPWRTAATRTNFAGGVDTFDALAARGRYLRVQANRRATIWGHSLWEVRIFGNAEGACGTPRCGNGALEPGEACDDGNVLGGDGCSATCSLETSCRAQRLTAIAARASSVESATFAAAFAIDGDTATRWSSVFSDPQWLEADLGAPHHLARVVLNWERAHARDYRVEVATQAAGPWTAVATRSGFAGGIDTFPRLAATARYVRMYASARATGWGNSLWELELYGDPNASCR